jgi:predicted AAA+ superfamily ATPase
MNVVQSAVSIQQLVVSRREQIKIIIICVKSVRISVVLWLRDLPQRFIKNISRNLYDQSSKLELESSNLESGIYLFFLVYSLKLAKFGELIIEIMIKRELYTLVNEKLYEGKAIIILGARQTGKTTLVRKILKGQPASNALLNCDEPGVRSLLEDISTARWKQIIGDNKIIVIDEAQQIKDIGIKLKLVTDEIPDVQLIVTGSSALELANEINEPLTGRKWEYFLYPVSWHELGTVYNFVERVPQVEQRMIFGMYPEVIMNPGKELEILNNLAGSYLYKDLLSFKGIRKPGLLEQLLRALALQVGSEVSYNELGNMLQVDKNTVMTYIDLLEKAFIVFRLNPLSRNLRKEISTSRKIYFYDNGIRNALIANFNPLNIRSDTGQLWENFIISERKKHNHYKRRFLNMYFWRTHDQQEIDLIEESGGVFEAFEFKWNKKKHSRSFDLFGKYYPLKTGKEISREDIEEFLG